MLIPLFEQSSCDLFSVVLTLKKLVCSLSNVHVLRYYEPGYVVFMHGSVLVLVFRLAVFYPLDLAVVHIN